jgi:hypothetical protein
VQQLSNVLQTGLGLGVRITNRVGVKGKRIRQGQIENREKRIEKRE